MSKYFVLDPFNLETDEEKEIAEDYGVEEFDTRSFLIGPNGFVCVLGEPEDCTWNRDGSEVVSKLNELQDFYDKWHNLAEYMENNPSVSSSFDYIIYPE